MEKNKEHFFVGIQEKKGEKHLTVLIDLPEYLERIEFKLQDGIWEQIDRKYSLNNMR